MAHSPVDLRLGLTEIVYTGEPADWDDRMVSVRYVEEAGPDGTVFPRKVTEVEPEPAYTIAAPRPGSAAQKKAPAAGKDDAKGGKGGKGAAKDAPAEKAPSPPNTLKVYAVADNAKYECEAASRPIVFRPTMMFQTRTFSFPLKNTWRPGRIKPDIAP